MSQKANPTIVGLFVVVGVALGVAGVLLFSSSRLFTTTYEYIVYFDSSLNGLSEGAPVKFRGVTVGAVKRVMINFAQATNDFAMPVLIEVRKDLIKQRSSRMQDFGDPQVVRNSVQRGLRASLSAESFVTGVLYIDLEVGASAPPPVYHELSNWYTEIPSRPTRTQELLKNIAELDIKRLEQKLGDVLNKIDLKLDDLKMDDISNNLTNVLSSLSDFVRSKELTNALVGLGTTLDRFRTLAEHVDVQVVPLVRGVTNSHGQANLTLARLREAVEDVRSLLGPEATLRGDLALALSQIAAAGQSISELADFLQRHPNALITGRSYEEKKR